MAHRLLWDPNENGWERSDFPIVCESCLGPNPYVRMQRVEFGGECHISGRPYTVFRWRPGSDARYKKTIICQEVAKAKNVCQVCLLDLDYNLPVQVRDTALGKDEEQLPESDVGKEYTLARMAADGELSSSYTQQQANDTILKLQRTTPYYKRNRAHICSFYVRGECKRGAECPYRHEMPTTGELANQNIKDRYYGTNDPVAKKMLSRVENLPSITPPDDTSITTLYVGGMTPEISEEDLKDRFYSYGELSSVKKVDSRSCAFVTFTTRQAAERAAEDLAGRLIVKGIRLKLLWGRPQEKKTEEAAPAAGPPAFLPPQVAYRPPAGTFPPPYGARPPGMPAPGSMPPLAQPYYPSMDPLNMGTHIPAPGTMPPPQQAPGAKREALGSPPGAAAKRQRGPEPAAAGSGAASQQPGGPGWGGGGGGIPGGGQAMPGAAAYGPGGAQMPPVRMGPPPPGGHSVMGPPGGALGPRPMAPPPVPQGL